jgi:5-methylcytosine-specific restriction endonuclease McrA
MSIQYSTVWLALVAACLSTFTLPADGSDRSRALRAEFLRQHPCPSTGLPRGACPGWQVDHIEALVCGGRDELRNLQWLTIEEHRQKTRVEVKLCRGR